MAHTFGVLLGALAGGATGVFLVAVLFKYKILDNTFDERQERARGQAFARGFVAMIVSVLAYGVSDLLFGRWIEPLAGAMLCVCVGAAVFAAGCIRRDAYLSLQERPAQVAAVLAAFGGLNLALSLLYIHRGELVQGGVLTFRAANLFAGATCLAILLVYAAHRRAGQEDGE